MAPNLVGPGVGVISSIERDPAGVSWYQARSGTSMAAAYVTGVAALVASATGLQGAQLQQHLIDTARVLTGPPDRVGAGLVQFVV